MKNKLSKVFSTLFFFFTFFFLIVAQWIPDNFGENINMTQIVYLLSSPMEGTDKTLVYSFILKCVLLPILFTVIIYYIIFHKHKMDLHIKIQYKKKIKKLSFFRLLRIIGSFMSIVAFIFSFVICANKVQLYEYWENSLHSSEIYEKYYVDPATQKYQFPEKKRNLIYIFMESMETTYLSKNLGGGTNHNVIPGLSELIRENVSFTDNSGHGYYSASGTGWTVAGMVGQTAGINLNAPIDGNSYGQNGESFLPGAYSIGDILDKAGYNQELLIGSDAIFGGRKTYFQEHGNYKIADFNYAVENDWVDPDYNIGWWGFEDKKLFEFAKNELLDLASKDEPFNLTMLTVDTHFPEGYLDETCPTPFDNHYSNVLACSSNMVNQFIRWVQSQPFYDNTTIVIAGDHLSMDPNWFKNIDNKYPRRALNLIINSAVQPAKDAHDRTISTLDLFPTTLASMGVTFDGNRLGLGTNLFSKEKTLIEKMGIKKFDKELSRNSKYYNKNILK